MKYTCGHCGELFDDEQACKTHEHCRHAADHDWNLQTAEIAGPDDEEWAVTRECSVCGVVQGVTWRNCQLLAVKVLAMGVADELWSAGLYMDIEIRKAAQ